MAREYVPTDAYGLLRRIVGQGLQRVRRDSVERDPSAKYLISRGLAAANGVGDRMEETEAGRTVGLIDWQER